MKRLAIIAQKGGVGKTTLAINLGVSAHLNGKSAVIIDLEPQASAARWGDLRRTRNSLDQPLVQSAQYSRLPAMLDVAKQHGIKLAIIDTAANSEQAALTAARNADFVLIPCRPGFLDLETIGLSVDCALNMARSKACVVLTMVPPAGPLGDNAADAIRSRYQIDIAPTRICYRAAYNHALTSGLAVPEYDGNCKAAEEIEQLYTWMCRQVYV